MGWGFAHCEKNGKTGELGQDRLEVRWEAVMCLFNVVNLNVWLFLSVNLAKCFVGVVWLMFGLAKDFFISGIIVGMLLIITAEVHIILYSLPIFIDVFGESLYNITVGRCQCISVLHHPYTSLLRHHSRKNTYEPLKGLKWTFPNR